MSPAQTWSILGLLRKWRWVLLLAFVASVGVGVPLALAAPPEYSSDAEVLIPASDPVTLTTTQVSAVTIQLLSYAKGDLESDVRSVLGEQASELQFVDAVQQRSEDVWVVTATAETGSTAERAVETAAGALFERSNELADQQVDRLRLDVEARAESITQELATLGEQRRSQNRTVNSLWDKRVRLLKSPSAGDQATIARLSERLKDLRAERSRTYSEIRVLESNRDALQSLVHEATEQNLKRRAASTLISLPSTADTTIRTRIISTVGLAVLAGLTVSFLTILAIERWRRRSRSPASGSARLAGQLEFGPDGADRRKVRTP